MFPRSPRSLVAWLTAGLLASATLHAEQDVPPVDVAKMLKDLRTVQEQQTTQGKATRQAAIQKISAVVNNPAAALELWEEAIRITQMEGAGKEATQFHAWKDAEGDLYKEKEVLNAIHLHLEWLLLTLQRSNGMPVKDLVTPVINFTRELLADQAMMDALDDAIKKEKEQVQPAAGGRRGRGGKIDPAQGDQAVKKIHEMILRTPMGSSMIVQWLKLSEFASPENWEPVAGNFDGIYKNIVQPELRAELDARVFDYWDAKLRKEADLATRSKLTFEVDKFNTQRRPALLWERMQEYLYLGQKNRAVSEMYKLIQGNPTHPDATDWIATLKGIIAPPAAEAPATSTAPSPGLTPVPPPAATAAPPPAAPLPPGVSPSTAALPGAR